MKVAITNYTGDRGNWGCQATSRQLLSFLREVFAKYGSVEFSTVPLPANHPSDEFVANVHGSRIKKIYSRSAPSRSDLEFLDDLCRERFGRLYKLAREADVIVLNGEGTAGESSNFRTTRLYALPLLAKLLWRKPVLSLNQTIYADASETAAARNVYGSFDLIAVREMASYRFCRELGLDRAVLCPDMAFRAFGEDAEVESGHSAPIPSRPFFCVTGSGAVHAYDLAALADIVREIAQRHKLMPCFMQSRRADEKALAVVGSRLGGIPFAAVSSRQIPNVAGILPLLRQARFVLGGRFHTAVSALAQETPVVLLPASTFKSQGIGPMLGLDIPVFRPTETDSILARVGTIVKNENETRRSIHTAIAASLPAFESLAAYIRRIVDHRRELDERVPVAPAELQPPFGENYCPIRLDAIHRRGGERVIRRQFTRWLDAIRLEALRKKPSYLESIDETFVRLP